jgi:hypothetical protein
MIEPDPEPTMTSDEAWAALTSANLEKDLDDFKVFFLEYVRNNKQLTFVDLEKMFREHHFEVYLIAMVTLPNPSFFVSPFPSLREFSLSILCYGSLFYVLIVGKRDSATENDSQFAGGNRKEIPCLLPTRSEESPHSVPFPFPHDIPVIPSYPFSFTNWGILE